MCEAGEERRGTALEVETERILCRGETSMAEDGL